MDYKLTIGKLEFAPYWLQAVLEEHAYDPEDGDDASEDSDHPYTLGFV